MKPLLRVFHTEKDLNNEDLLQLVIGIETSHNVIYGYKKEEPLKVHFMHIDDKAVIARAETSDEKYNLITAALNSNWKNIRACKEIQLQMTEILAKMYRVESISDGIKLNTEFEYQINEIRLLEEQNKNRLDYLTRALS